MSTWDNSPAGRAATVVSPEVLGELGRRIDGRLEELLEELRRERRPCIPWSFAVAAVGVNAIVPPMGGAICVTSYVLVANGIVNARWGEVGPAGSSFGVFEGTGVDAGRMSMGLNTVISAQAGGGVPFLLRTNSGKGLALNLTTNVEVGGHLTFYVEG